MHSLFPHAQIICDRFHYIRLAGQNFIQSRLDACSFLHDKPLAKSIKRNLRLFYKYKKDLDNDKTWYDFLQRTSGRNGLFLFCVHFPIQLFIKEEQAHIRQVSIMALLRV